MKWAWVWIGFWTLLTVGGAIQLLVDDSVHGFRYLTLAAGIAIWAVTLVKWFPRRLPLVDFWKGSYTGFSIAYVVASVDFAALWQSIAPLFFVVMVYMGFLENYRFTTWLDDQDPTTE
ncbi:hypothetical protein [Corynebacterium sp. HMSC073D01]|uniref:hypothetical protein n=1 Tax=Corynebacterium sp. HMSC073D01 TaxID=1739536 RepID=UPI0008A367D8|nr:hypothetical protein [Corynebacterium sp. HMSC073D01]OFO49520.1 hypothetical protein HMPREF3044_07030 [Corynebacterium sp. HMSC073D01]